MKLTPAQRRAVFAGNYPNIGGEGDPPPVGHVLELSTRVSLRVDAIHPREKGWELAYTVQDFRDEPHLARASKSVRQDDSGAPLLDENSPEAHGYGARPGADIGADRRVSPEWQDRLTKASEKGWDQYMSVARADEIRERESLALFNRARRLHKEALKRKVDLRPALEAFIDQAKDELAA